MNNQIIRRMAILAAPLALSTLLIPGLAQAPAPPLTLIPRYRSDSHLFYALAIHSVIGSQATLDTAAEIDMHILPGATPGHFDAELRFTQFATTVKAASGAEQADLAKQASDTDHAARSMSPPRFRVSPAQIEVLARSPGADYDQPVEMLEELARTDSLPTGPVRIGDQWSRQRSRSIPGMNFSMALTQECRFSALGPNPASGPFSGQPTATIGVHSHGSTPLPPGSLPGSQEMAAQGLVPEATLGLDADATTLYRAVDAVLLQTSSESHTQMHIRLVGPSPQAQTSDSDVNSTSTLTLERITGGQ